MCDESVGLNVSESEKLQLEFLTTSEYHNTEYAFHIILLASSRVNKSYILYSSLLSYIVNQFEYIQANALANSVSKSTGVVFISISTVFSNTISPVLVSILTHVSISQVCIYPLIYIVFVPVSISICGSRFATTPVSAIDQVSTSPVVSAKAKTHSHKASNQTISISFKFLFFIFSIKQNK
jgi:hypothetical protein